MHIPDPTLAMVAASRRQANKRRIRASGRRAVRLPSSTDNPGPLTRSTLAKDTRLLLEMPNPKTNQLLAALPKAEWRRWKPLLEEVDMPLGEVVYESGAVLGHVYFPITAIVSLLYVMESGASAEIAVIGK